MAKRLGKATICLETQPSIAGYAAHVGKKEQEGPLGRFFAHYDNDTTMGQDSWEKAESELQRRTFTLAKASAGLENEQIDLLLGGDLLNQCIASGYATRGTNIPFAGLFGACSTMAESLGLAACLVDGNVVRHAAAITSSHFCTAERQFRFPLEYGGQRTPSSQWTVTGSGCVIVGKNSNNTIRIPHVCFGVVADQGVTDINNMGSAMAPAAADTLVRFLRDTGTKPENYDAIITGDLGLVGSRVFMKLCSMEGFEIDNHSDCGLMIFDRDTQNVGAGGSGCGCSASVLSSVFLPQLERGELGSILFMATGALMSPTTTQQGESIPSIAHLVHLVSSKHYA